MNPDFIQVHSQAPSLSRLKTLEFSFRAAGSPRVFRLRGTRHRCSWHCNLFQQCLFVIGADHKGKFQAENKPNNKHHKMYRQFAKPPGQTPGEYSRDYPRTTTMDGDDKRYGKLKAPIGDGLFAAYDPLDMKAAKYLIVASSAYLYTPRSLF